jgi:eight-cysteine-cluster-containing protein
MRVSWIGVVIATLLLFATHTPIAHAASACKTGGCSGELCVAVDSPSIASTCIYRPEYACLKQSRCELQASGQCGWTKTPEYTRCLANPQPSLPPLPTVIPTPPPPQPVTTNPILLFFINLYQHFFHSP